MFGLVWRELLQQLLNKFGNILTLAKRCDHHSHAINSVVQILTKTLLVDQSVQLT
ncbi:hypothetical protein O164_26835 [Pseudomonas taiwanensis SJ9]|uniref:Uncharacterized protein n=1 Tax=Pseudomonas taiwanensis SJ9 TaxID=1388762 RepID=V7D5V9_9PSED|nr:hypothetical protein O164_26835 [Pseudomonas taiwanensis SJ9]